MVGLETVNIQKQNELNHETSHAEQKVPPIQKVGPGSFESTQRRCYSLGGAPVTNLSLDLLKELFKLDGGKIHGVWNESLQDGYCSVIPFMHGESEIKYPDYVNCTRGPEADIWSYCRVSPNSTTGGGLFNSTVPTSAPDTWTNSTMTASPTLNTGDGLSMDLCIGIGIGIGVLLLAFIGWLAWKGYCCFRRSRTGGPPEGSDPPPEQVPLENRPDGAPPPSGDKQEDPAQDSSPPPA